MKKNTQPKCIQKHGVGRGEISVLLTNQLKVISFETAEGSFDITCTVRNRKEEQFRQERASHFLQIIREIFVSSKIVPDGRRFVGSNVEGIIIRV